MVQSIVHNWLSKKMGSKNAVVAQNSLRGAKICSRFSSFYTGRYSSYKARSKQVKKVGASKFS